MSLVNSINIDGIEYMLGKAGVDTDDATALASDILLGKTAYARGSKLTGTIQLKESETIIPGISDKIIPSGSYLNGELVIKGDSNLISDKLFKGDNIFGVNGSSPKCIIIASGWAGGQQGIIYTPVPLYNSSGEKIFDAGSTGLSPGASYTFISPFTATRKYYWAYYMVLTCPTSLVEGSSVTISISRQSDRCVGCAIYQN